MKRPFTMTAYRLKWLALFTMTWDHLFKIFAYPSIALLYQTGLFDEISVYFAYYLVCGIGRWAFPIYAFLIAQGCQHTHNLRSYCLRLGALALLSEVPYQMLIAKIEEVPFVFHLGLSSIFVTLCLGAITCGLYQAGKQAKLHPWMSCLLIAGIVLLAHWLDCDYGPFGVLLILVCYVSKTKRQLAYAISLCLLGITLYYLPLPLSEEYWMYDLMLEGMLLLFAVASLWWILRYQGERGKRFGYGVYVYYPIHLLVLIAIYHLCYM